MRAETLLTNLAKVKPSVPSSSVEMGNSRFLVLDSFDLARLRAEVIRLAAELRPGKGATNFGVTPKWYRERVAFLDSLRARLAAAAEATGVGA